MYARLPGIRRIPDFSAPDDLIFIGVARSGARHGTLRSGVQRQTHVAIWRPGIAGPTAYGTTPLSGEEILKQVEQHREQLRALGVRTIGLFGSYRRGTPHAESDLDFLVTLDRPSFRDYMAVKIFLEDLFRR